MLVLVCLVTVTVSVKVEAVTATADFTNPEDAAEYLRALQEITLPPIS